MDDVQLAELQNIDEAEYVYVETCGIPNYDMVMTQEMVDALNARPLASTDFVAGVTSATRAGVHQPPLLHGVPGSPLNAMK